MNGTGRATASGRSPECCCLWSLSAGRAEDDGVAEVFELGDQAPRPTPGARSPNSNTSATPSGSARTLSRARFRSFTGQSCIVPSPSAWSRPAPCNARHGQNNAEHHANVYTTSRDSIWVRWTTALDRAGTVSFERQVRTALKDKDRWNKLR